MPDPHPYYPPLVPMHTYVSPGHSDFQVFLTVGLTALLTNLVVQKALGKPSPNGPMVGTKGRLKAIWFTCCLSTHLLLEPHFVFWPYSLPGSKGLAASLWKFYALCDSRYMMADSFIWSLEAATVFIIAPFCILALYGIYKRNRAWEIVGTVASSALYLCTDGLYYWDALPGQYSRPEPIYYWGFFVVLNAPWLIVPAILIVDSIKTLNRELTPQKGVRVPKARSE